MSVRIMLAEAFGEYTGNREAVEVEGATVRECLDNLITLFPVFRELLYGGDYSLGVLVSYRGEIVVASRLDLPVAQGDEISLFPMIYGG